MKKIVLILYVLIQITFISCSQKLLIFEGSDFKAYQENYSRIYLPYPPEMIISDSSSEIYVIDYLIKNKIITAQMFFEELEKDSIYKSYLKLNSTMTTKFENDIYSDAENYNGKIVIIEMGMMKNKDKIKNNKLLLLTNFSIGSFCAGPVHVFSISFKEYDKHKINNKYISDMIIKESFKFDGIWM